MHLLVETQQTAWFPVSAIPSEDHLRAEMSREFESMPWLLFDAQIATHLLAELELELGCARKSFQSFCPKIPSTVAVSRSLPLVKPAGPHLQHAPRLEREDVKDPAAMLIMFQQTHM